LDAGADLIDMEMVQFHPTGMVWPPSVRGILVTESVRGDGGTLRNSKSERFMFNYVPEFFRAETADTEVEADAWYEDKTKRRTPDLLPRDEVARAINAEVKAGRGTEHGGVFLDIASRRSADYIKKRLPSMYHQFLELADVDITTTPMEVGPTCHYMMGGVRVDADTTATSVPGLFAAGEVAAGLHGANRLGGNSLSDLLVFGQRAGLHAAHYASDGGRQPSVDPADIEKAACDMLAPFDHSGTENPFAVHADLETCMQDLVGIIRAESELEQALEEIERLKQRAASVRVDGNRYFNPGWHMALDLQTMLSVSEAITRSALARKESRGGHTRSDYPGVDPHFAKVNLVTRRDGSAMTLAEEPLPTLPDDLKQLVEETGGH
jgi:succinate dehydrogenase / fumarate reductase flavoprotein subunit